MTEGPRVLALFGSAVLYGSERGNIEALAALQEQGAEVLCLVRNEKWNTLVPPALEARGLAWRKVPYIEHILVGRFWYVLLRNPLAFLIANWMFVRIVREFKPTHIHCYSQLFILNFLAGLMLVRTPMVFRAGDEPTLHNWVWRASWRFVVRRTYRFVANAEFIARSLHANGVTPERISVIYNAPPKRSHRGTKLLDLGLPTGARALCFIGQVAEHKGPHLLIDAFRALALQYTDLHLFIAGRISDYFGDDWARALLKRTVEDPTIGGRVTFLGEVENVPDLLARCVVLVVPSLFADPSPNVVMEAKEAGRPAIVFPSGGLPELIENCVDGLVCRGPNVPALVGALQFYLDEPALASSHGAAARASMVKLGIPEFGRKWREIYEISTSRTVRGSVSPSLREPTTGKAATLDQGGVTQ